MSKTLKFGVLIVLLSSIITSESRSPFKSETEDDVKIHKPTNKNDVPLAFQKKGVVVASNIDGYLHISLPLQPINDSIAMAEKHYEQGKKRVSLGLDTYQPCENKCKSCLLYTSPSPRD